MAISSTPATISVKVDPKVGIGFSTILGVLAATVQFLGTVALLIEDGHVDLADFAPMATGAATLIATIQGRMGQAKEALRGTPLPLLEPPKYATGWTWGAEAESGNGMSKAPSGNTVSQVNISNSSAERLDLREAKEATAAAEAELAALSEEIAPPLDPDLDDRPEVPAGAASHAAGNPGEDPDAPDAEMYLSAGGSATARAGSVKA